MRVLWCECADEVGHRIHHPAAEGERPGRSLRKLGWPGRRNGIETDAQERLLGLPRVLECGSKRNGRSAHGAHYRDGIPAGVKKNVSWLLFWADAFSGVSPLQFENRLL